MPSEKEIKETMTKLLKHLKELWEPYPDLNWPRNWLLAGLLMRHVPGRQCAWHFNREIALLDIEPLKIIWAEGYYGFWVLISAIYDWNGVQHGFCQIVRWTRSEERARAIARNFVKAWQGFAEENILGDMAGYARGGDNDIE